MTHFRRLAASMQLGLVFTLAAGTAGAAAEECQSIHVFTNARDVMDCPTDRNADFCIVRTSIVDRSGLLTGRLEYFEDSTKGSEHPQDPSMNLFVGVSKISTAKGTVELEERGIFDPKTLEFAGLARVGGGTGELEGYSGTVTSSGNAKGTGEIEGMICKG